MIKYDPAELFAMLTDATRKELLNPARNDIPVPEGFDDAYNEALEREAHSAEHSAYSAWRGTPSPPSPRLSSRNVKSPRIPGG